MNEKMLTCIVLLMLSTLLLFAVLAIRDLQKDFKQLKTDYSILLENYNENEYMYRKLEGK